MTGLFDRLSTTLALLALLLALILHHTDLQPSPSVAATTTDIVEGTDEERSSGRDLQTLPPLPKLSTAFVDRPLFNAHRKKAADKPSPARPAAVVSTRAPDFRVESRNLKILGIFGIEGQPTALVREGHGQSTRKVKVGDLIDGWRVATIDVRGLTLKHGDRLFRTSLYAEFDIAK